MISPDRGQRSSFSKESEVKGGFSAIDMERLASRLSKNIIGSVNVNPSDAGKRPCGIVDIYYEAETLLRAIESDHLNADSSESMPHEASPESTSAAAFRDSDAANNAANEGESQYPAFQPLAGISVVFEQITVREYPRIVGTHVLPSGGPSITMDWTYTEHPPLSVDDFESIRTGRRHGKDLLIGKTRREKIASRILAESNVKLADQEAKPVLSIKNRLKSILTPQRQ